MQPPPPGWPRIASALFYREPREMIDWLCQAFGFAVRVKVEGQGGRIEHSELVFGDAVVMVSGERPTVDARFGNALLSPLSAGGTTQSLFIYVDDLTGHCQRARASGARIVQEPQLQDYGEEYWADRNYSALDPEGHVWWFAERIRNPKG